MAAARKKTPSQVLPQGFALPLKQGFALPLMPNGKVGKPKRDQATANITVRLVPKDKRSLLKHIGKKPVSVWIREAVAEKLARELEERSALLGDAQALLRQENLPLEG